MIFQLKTCITRLNSDSDITATLTVYHKPLDYMCPTVHKYMFKKTGSTTII